MRILEGKAAFIDLPKQWSEWKIVEEIGSGAYGTVYMAQKTGDEDCVSAVKVIHLPPSYLDTAQVIRECGGDEAQASQYFHELALDCQKEVDTLTRLGNSPNIVSCQDFCVQKQADNIGWDMFIRMEYLTPFQEYCTSHLLEEKDVIRLGVDLCTALAACHAQGILHRDIKPENILVSNDGVFKLGDFGVAKNISMTSGTLSVKGTFSFMAPEVYRSQKYDGRADIYSLGLVLYRQMNHNRDPFVDLKKQILYYKDQEDALNERMKGTALPAPVDASPELTEIILHACAYNPNDRYNSADEMLRDLRALAEGKYKLKKRKPRKKINVKRYFVLVAVAVVAALCGIGVKYAYDANTVIGTGQCGDYAYWTLYNNGTLIVEGEGEVSAFPSYTTLSDYSTSVTKIVINEGITSTGYQAFGYFYNLKTVELPESLTVIGADTFVHCTSLEHIDLPSKLTEIGNQAFRECSSLSEITFPDTLEKIGGSAFYKCEKLTHISFPESITTIGRWAFEECTSLTTVEMPSHEIDFGGDVFLNTPWIEEQGEYWARDGVLLSWLDKDATEVVIPEDVTKIEDFVFDGFDSLESVTLHDNITYIGEYAFQGCSSLTEIELPEKIEYIGEDAFYGCSSLSVVNLPDTEIEIKGLAFQNTPWLESQGDYWVRDGILLAWIDLETEAVVIPEDVTVIGEYALYDCMASSVTIPDTVIKIMNNAFLCCENLKTLQLPETITEIEAHAFEGCSGLTEISLPENLETLGEYAFSTCSALEEIVIPSKLTTIAPYTFEACNALTTVEIPDNIISIGEYAFGYCTSLKSVTISDHVKSIGTHAFVNCYALEEVIMDDELLNSIDIDIIFVETPWLEAQQEEGEAS